MFATTIAFDDPRLFPPLLRLSDGVKRPDVRKVMGRAITGALRAHFTTLNRERPNKLGGKRTHFWAQVRRSVQQPELMGGDGLKVSINHVGAALQYFGGEVVAGAKGSGKKWLTIPARAEAHGKRAGEFNDLHFVLFRRNLAALVQNEQTVLADQNRKRRREGPVAPETAGGGVFYWLKPRVHIDEDPTVLPPDEALQQIALEAGEEYIGLLIEREKGGA